VIPCVFQGRGGRDWYQYQPVAHQPASRVVAGRPALAADCSLSKREPRRSIACEYTDASELYRTMVVRRPFVQASFSRRHSKQRNDVDPCWTRVVNARFQAACPGLRTGLGRYLLWRGEARPIAIQGRTNEGVAHEGLIRHKTEAHGPTNDDPILRGARPCDTR
jgi:hypothetical protein